MRIGTGQAAINRPAGAPYDMPVGGTKHSGYGKEMGPHVLKESTLQKLVTARLRQATEFSTWRLGSLPSGTR